MRISIFGLGYVGSVSAACFADMGHTVIGIDPNQTKLDAIQSGHSPVIEPDLDQLITQAVEHDRLRVTSEVTEAITQTDLSLICVGTPSCRNGSLNLRYITRVVEQIGTQLSRLDRYHVVVIRSTLLPGTLHQCLLPLLESSSGKRAGKDFGVCINPEFLREGTAITDFYAPPFSLIGEIDQASGDVLEQLYRDISAPVHRVEPDEACMIKYASNAFHALKVSFANEIGSLCSDMNLDGQKIMDIFSQDRLLNISAHYLRPGLPFGGSCLPKDIRALTYAAKHRDVELPLISSILPSNDSQIERILDLLVAEEKRHIALLGLSFKPGTDDLRESPLVRLAEALIGKGFDLQIYDEEVSFSNIFGKNRAYMKCMLPHLDKLLCTDLEQTVRNAELILIGKQKMHRKCMLDQLRPEQTVLDLWAL